MELTLLTDPTAREIFDLPPAPEPWIRLHKVAAGTSLAAGALAYTITHVSGKAATAAIANSIRISGSVLTHIGRILAGDIVGLSIQTGVRTTAYVVEQTGESATLIGALLASTVAAVTVGSTFLIGNTLHDIYMSSFLSKPFPEITKTTETTETTVKIIESIEELDSEYAVYLLEDIPSSSKPTDIEAVD